MGGRREAFEDAVGAVRHVVDARRLFGDPDYLLQVVARDLPHFQAVYDDTLAALPGVANLRSAPVMKTVARNRALPV